MTGHVEVPVPAHSGAETALSGAGALSQDDGVAVDSPASPLAAGSQASVGGLAGEHLPHAAGSAVYTSAHLVANDSALSVVDLEGDYAADDAGSVCSALSLLTAVIINLDYGPQAATRPSQARNEPVALIPARTRLLQTHSLPAWCHKQRLTWNISRLCQLCNR